jgi:hypothetical protein
MASTFQGLTILGKVSIVFVIILVWVIVYGLLEKIQPMGKDKKNLHALVALMIAFLVGISGSAGYMITFMTTWFFVLGLFIFLIIFVIGIFGVKEADFMAAGKKPEVYFWIIVFGVIIGMFALGNSFGQSLLEGRSGQQGGTAVTPVEVGPDGTPIPVATTPTSPASDYGKNVLLTLTHPKVLGFIMIMLIGVIAVTFLTKSG